MSTLKHSLLFVSHVVSLNVYRYFTVFSVRSIVLMKIIQPFLHLKSVHTFESSLEIFLSIVTSESLSSVEGGFIAQRYSTLRE